jgi:PPK2 family polyphosphate:nucleotide phosphotransferase
MPISSPHLIKPGKAVHIEKLSTDFTGDFKDKDDALKVAQKNLKRLAELQELLYAESKHAVLVVLQATDTGGKDGAIEFVFSGINPQGCRVESFKAPSTLERSHDYLWREHMRCPSRGMIGIFNRSHYEDILITRVARTIDTKTAQRRFRQINDFERMLSEEGTTILKFFLHISKDEQKDRLIARQQDKAKWWKFSPADLEARKQWAEYQKAYEDMLAHTSTDYAPWYAIPADRKWYRNWAISDILVRAIEALDPKYPKPEVDPRKFLIE